MKTLTAEQFEKYAAEPLRDAWLRAALWIPGEKYYTVSMWPVPWIVRILWGTSRDVKAPKISKSSQFP